MLKQEAFAEDLDRDDAWLKAHLEFIVDQYAHQVIAILDQQIVAVAPSIADLHRTLAQNYPERVPLIFEVPSPQEFECLLSNTLMPWWQAVALPSFPLDSALKAGGSGSKPMWTLGPSTVCSNPIMPSLSASSGNEDNGSRCKWAKEPRATTRRAKGIRATGPAGGHETSV